MLLQSFKKRRLAILIDPDKTDDESLGRMVKECEENPVDFFLVGGSLIMGDSFDKTINYLKNHSQIPVYIFPGNMMQVSDKADGILLLSLISGRNPDFLIGQHVLVAPKLKKANIDVIPTGYILVDSGSRTSVEYMSNTLPIPSDKPEIAVCTAMAGEQLGMKAIYLEAGSGAQNKVNAEMITAVKSNISCLLIVGGGIKTSEDAEIAFNAGADIVVVGTAVEKDIHLINDFVRITKN